MTAATYLPRVCRGLATPPDDDADDRHVVAYETLLEVSHYERHAGLCATIPRRMLPRVVAIAAGETAILRKRRRWGRLVQA